MHQIMQLCLIKILKLIITGNLTFTLQIYSSNKGTSKGVTVELEVKITKSNKLN